MNTAPDLKNGYMINGGNGENNWATVIQCALRVGSRTFFLAHECRAERLPYSSGRLGGGSRIFQADLTAEYTVVADQNGDFFATITTGDLVNLPEHSSDMKVAVPLCGLPGRTSSVCAPMRPIERIPADQLFQALLNRSISVADLFLAVRRKKGTSEFVVHAPCNYINFGDAISGRFVYIQPITGQVLFPHENTLSISYLACAVGTTTEHLIEFCVRYYEPLKFSVAGKSTGEGDPNNCDGGTTADPAILLAISKFRLIQPIDGDVSFYRYLD